VNPSVRLCLFASAATADAAEQNRSELKAAFIYVMF